MTRRTLVLEMAHRSHGLWAAKVHSNQVSVSTMEDYAARPGGAQGRLHAEMKREEQAHKLALTKAAYQAYRDGQLPAGPGAQALIAVFEHVDAELAKFTRRLGQMQADGNLPDPRAAQIVRPKDENAHLRERLATCEQRIAELTQFRTIAIARLVAQHDEIATFRQSLAAQQRSRTPHRGYDQSQDVTWAAEPAAASGRCIHLQPPHSHDSAGTGARSTSAASESSASGSSLLTSCDLAQSLCTAAPSVVRRPRPAMSARRAGGKPHR
jgi:hypothetical protein